MASDAVEILAGLEHEQWIEWSRNIAETEDLSPDRIERWGRYWIPYDQLDEPTKDHDRRWSLEAIRRLEAAGFAIVPAGRIEHVTRDSIGSVTRTDVDPSYCTHEGIGLPGCPTCDPDAIDRRRSGART